MASYPHIKRLFAQPEGTVIAVQVRASDPPQFVAQDMTDLEALAWSGVNWTGEQCDSCGCSAYAIERDENFDEDVIMGWRMRCCGDPAEAARWEREGAEPAAVAAWRTGCSATYPLRYLSEDLVTF